MKGRVEAWTRMCPRPRAGGGGGGGGSGGGAPPGLPGRRLGMLRRGGWYLRSGGGLGAVHQGQGTCRRTGKVAGLGEPQPATLPARTCASWRRAACEEGGVGPLAGPSPRPTWPCSADTTRRPCARPPGLRAGIGRHTACVLTTAAIGGSLPPVCRGRGAHSAPTLTLTRLGCRLDDQDACATGPMAAGAALLPRCATRRPASALVLWCPWPTHRRCHEYRQCKPCACRATACHAGNAWAHAPPKGRHAAWWSFRPP